MQKAANTNNLDYEMDLDEYNTFDGETPTGGQTAAERDAEDLEHFTNCPGQNRDYSDSTVDSGTESNVNSTVEETGHRFLESLPENHEPRHDAEGKYDPSETAYERCSEYIKDATEQYITCTYCDFSWCSECATILSSMVGG
jgi:hypothetical protein